MQSSEQIRILVIDDDDSVRESFCNYLEDNDYSVVEASNGREGLEVFAAEQPDVVLVDLRMPEMDGLQVLEKISTQSPDTPLIVVSATGMVGDAVEAMHLGTWDYLLKPVTDLSIVRHSIVRVLDRARQNARRKQHVVTLQRQVNDLLAELGRDPQFPDPEIVDAEGSDLD